MGSSADRSLTGPGLIRRRIADIGMIAEPDILSLAMALQNSRLRGVMATAGLRPEQAAELRAGLARPLSVRRPLYPLLECDAAIRNLIVRDYRSKDTAVHEVSTWASGRGLSSRSAAALEQAVDELLLNALYDAPHDANGRPRYLELSPRQRLDRQALPGEQAEVRYASDSRRVIVAVRDHFGGLRRSTVLDYLVRCALAQTARRSPLEDKPGGAGVGLYLVAGIASELLFRLRRGRFTEVVCVIYRERVRSLRALVIDDL